jgi:hypothetical protein
MSGGLSGAGSPEFMSAMMNAMLILAAPACLVVTGIAVLAYRKWKRDPED